MSINAVWRSLFTAERDEVLIPTSLLKAKLVDSLRTSSGLKAAASAAFSFLRKKEKECTEAAELVSQDDGSNGKVVEVPVDEVRIGLLLEILEVIVHNDTIVSMPVKETMDS